MKISRRILLKRHLAISAVDLDSSPEEQNRGGRHSAMVHQVSWHCRPLNSRPQGLNWGKVAWMYLASSLVASSSDMFSQWMSHYGTATSYVPALQGICLRWRATRGAVFTLPSGVSRGKRGFGTARSPKCFFNWLTWKTLCIYVPSGSWSW
jgi:hypothetical protein